MCEGDEDASERDELATARLCGFVGGFIVGGAFVVAAVIVVDAVAGEVVRWGLWR